MKSWAKDYYAVLGVAMTATAEEIRGAFRRLAREHHPDVARDKRVGEERFKEINEAYATLGDPRKREDYDGLRSFAGFGNPGGAPGPGGGSDWGDGTGDYSLPRREGTRGNPLVVVVTLEEAVAGVQRKATVQTATRCPGCAGLWGSERYGCPDCLGLGRIRSTYEIHVRLPAGLRHGERFRVRSSTRVGSRRRKTDTFILIQLVPHPVFTVHGNDLEAEVEITPWDAVLGATVRVPVLGGSMEVKAPAGTAAGHRLRVKGAGMPTREGPRGDLLARIKVQVPSEVTPRQRELWEALRAEGARARAGGRPG